MKKLPFITLFTVEKISNSKFQTSNRKASIVNSLLSEIWNLKFGILLILFPSCEKALINADLPYETPQFSPEYVAQYNGKSFFEIPEVYELMMVAKSFSDFSLTHKNYTTNSDSEYFREVAAFFRPFKGHDVVKKLNANIKNIHDDYVYRENCYGFTFDQNNKIVSKNIYLGIVDGLYGLNKVKELLPDLADFAEKSNFRQFYKDHQAYYQKLIDVQKTVMPVKKMQDWLEARFPARYNSMGVIFSPLTGGNHLTENFVTPTFKQALLFVSFANFDKNKFNTAQIEGLASRIVFTEIDHNYVNLITNKYSAEMKTAIGDWKKWNNPSGNSATYDTPYLTFNEYMTWGVFSIYAQETCNKADFEVINAEVEAIMRNRGFNRFSNFNKEILRIYAENPKMGVDDLYLKMFEWMKKQ